ncbi:isoprenylcysteine carboxyl methyltransferase [Phlyctema vagabunda]|uniref:Protein-S-isoprenylcysteine O-methyltransferase n=1 Tax=Phlyctema vagabunda TaxID=108571 RepID=A0ABR4PVF3_9HELO
MPLAISSLQASLAGTMLMSTIGTYIALSPPNPSSASEPSTGDSLRWLKLTDRFTTKIAMAPLGLLALHHSALICLYPKIPSSIIRHGTENGLNPNLITWSAATSIPLALTLCAGIPLRLVSYASLGKNFTFALMEPDRLTTTGIYRYIQHPSYTGVLVLLICNAALLLRLDGALSCWVPPRLYQAFRFAYLALAPAGLSLLFWGVSTRVREEERMLQAKFGAEWASWHSKTARFIPWLL